MKIKSLFIVSALALASVNALAAETQVIAHRGYWKTDGSAQNSIRSLVKADSINAYGSEFDVWLTSDNKLVVNHDPSINGIVIETSTAAQAMAQKLANGENLSSLEAYLDKAKELKTRLICELKPHKDKKHEAEAVKAILKMVKKKGLESRMEYITFSLPGLVEFAKNVPQGTPVYYLNGTLTPEELKDLGVSGMDYHTKVMRAHPEWFAESHKLGLKVNVWTVNKDADLKWCIEQGADFVTTNEPERAKELVKK